MNFPVYLQIGSFKVLLHSVMEPLGMFTGFRYFLYLRKKKGDHIASEKRLWIIIGAVFGAILGSRLLGGFENPPALYAAKNLLFYFYENKTVVGGFLGGLAGVELTKLFLKEKHKSGDLFTYPMILALIIGRIGCFGMGIYEETYGTQTNLFTGVDLGDGFHRHPVTLYEIVFLILLWIGLVQVQKKFILEDGALFKIFLVTYIAFRFLLDFIKPHYTFSIGLSTIQIICILGLIYYRPYIFKPTKLLKPNA